MKTYKVDFLKFNRFYIVRIYMRGKIKDYLQPTLQDCYDFVEDLNNGYVRI